MEKELFTLATQLGEALLHRHKRLVTAESCTGGWLAEAVTMVAGSSQWFERGFITYSNEAKQDLLDVRSLTLHRHGAVSEEVAKEMAEGALRHSIADISVSITGIAGPTGGTEEKPVGSVWFGFASNELPTALRYQHFSGDRTQIRYAAVRFALMTLLELLA